MSPREKVQAELDGLDRSWKATTIWFKRAAKRGDLARAKNLEARLYDIDLLSMGLRRELHGLEREARADDQADLAVKAWKERL